jgi:hypothetical protein
MAKFRIRLKVQALELEIDGEREDIPANTAAVQQQFTGLVQPAEAMADGHKQLGPGDGPVIEAEVGKKKAARKRNGGGKSSDAATVVPLEFRHDASMYGNPQQGWNSSDKGIWLLYVLDDMDICQGRSKKEPPGRSKRGPLQA